MKKILTILILTLILVCTIVQLVITIDTMDVVHAIIPTDYNSNVGFNREYHGQVYTYANSICFNEDCSNQLIIK